MLRAAATFRHIAHHSRNLLPLTCTATLTQSCPFHTSATRYANKHKDYTIQADTPATSPTTTAHSITIDRSDLPRGPAPPAQPAHKPTPNELTQLLQQMIRVRGPITVHDFMYQALQHPTYGYYMSKANVLPGTNAASRGDFVTSPEIISLFGELICVWLVYTWQNMGSPAHIQLVELGPGKGTLMADIVRTAKTFPAFYRALSLHLLETSPIMRAHQQETLKVTITSSAEDTARLEQTLSQQHATQSQLNQFGLPVGELAKENAIAQQLSNAPSSSAHSNILNSTPTDVSIKGIIADKSRDIPVEWLCSVKQLSTDAPVFFVAHEFFDALPIRQFEYTSRGWCEKLVDIDDSSNTPHHFRHVLTNGPSLAARTFLSADRFPPEKLKIGQQVEVCTAALACMEEICGVIDRAGGAALVIDYGDDHSNENTLQVMHASTLQPFTGPYAYHSISTFHAYES